MNAARRHVLALVATALAFVTAPTAVADVAALAAVPLPPGATSRVVASDIVRNGRTTSSAERRTTAAVVDTLAFYRASWPATPSEPGHLENRLGGWSVLSRVEGRSLLVVQLRDGASGPEGFVSAMVLGVTTASAPPRPPMPAGGRLVSSTTARDGAALATTSVVTASARAGTVAAFYADRLVRDGWTLLSEGMHGGAPVLLLDRRGARVEIVVTEADGRSVVVVNEVRVDD